MENFKKFDVVVIGAGPAGLTASIYLTRSNLSVLMVDKEVPGGKIVTTATVENYPGFTTISGPDLALKMFSQAQANGVEFQLVEVTNLEQQDNKWWKVEFANGVKPVFAKVVIVATGMKNRKLDIPNQERLENKGVSYCAICDGTFHKGKPVAVIGSGRTAVDESIYLSDIASEVYVISNKPQLRAEETEIDKLKKKPNVHLIMDTNTLSYNGTNKLESLTLENMNNNDRYDLPIDGAFVFIGFLPIAPLVNNESMLSETSRFIDVDKNMRTKWDGVYAAGDITTKTVRQISTAINDGSIAAIDAHDYINGRSWE